MLKKTLARSTSEEELQILETPTELQRKLLKYSGLNDMTPASSPGVPRDTMPEPRVVMMDLE